MWLEVSEQQMKILCLSSDPCPLSETCQDRPEQREASLRQQVEKALQCPGALPWPLDALAPQDIIRTRGKRGLRPTIKGVPLAGHPPGPRGKEMNNEEFP